MRFKAVVEREQFSNLFGQLKLLQDQGRSAILSLSADVIRTIVKQDDDAMQLYATLSSAAIFSEIRVESRTANVIMLEISLANLVQALRPGQAAHSTTLKLTKRFGTPFLSVCTAMVDGGIEVAQDVPVRVLGAAEMASHREPDVGLETVRARLTFAAPRPVASVVERMRALLIGAGIGVGSVSGSSSSAAGSGGGVAGLGGVLKLEVDYGDRTVIASVRTDTVAARTFFRGLHLDVHAAPATASSSSTSSSAAGAGAGGHAGAGGADGHDGYGDDAAAAAAAAEGGTGAMDAAEVEPPPPASVYVNIRHVYRALRLVAGLGTALLLCVVPRRSLVLHSESVDRSSSVSFVLSLVDASAAGVY